MIKKGVKVAKNNKDFGEIFCFYRMKKKLGLYCIERVRTDGVNIYDIQEGEENIFEVIHENLSTLIRNNLSPETDNERPF